MRGRRKQYAVGWVFAAGAAFGYFAPAVAVLVVCGVVLVFSLTGKL